jgi:hypothetical protein
MASEANPSQEQHEQRQEHTANIDATHREAYEYWGYLLKSDKCGTPLLDRLLKGIAELIVSCEEHQAYVIVQNPIADDSPVEQQVRTQRFPRHYTFANSSLVSRHRRQLRCSLQRHAAVFNRIHLPLARRIP